MAETLSMKAMTAIAYRVMRSDLGRRACAEGWQIQLWDFVREHGRKPGEAEIDDCRLRAAAHAADMAMRWYPAAARASRISKMQRFERIAHGLE